MISKFRIHLIYLFYISLFLIQEIFSIEETSSDQTINHSIRCSTTCVASIVFASALIIAGSTLAIFRIQKKPQRQKTGHIEEEIATMKYEDVNPSFETIKTQPVFQNTQDRAKTS
ncbi:hypothetical protein C1645_786928 [Glomus cerebriforme]|uniref:Uncharacterized protein n=1 Tax=Glomus cerebriforme TaxID=658196 RepID=A0A397SB17_9GLOM|nr:hypothetical protein C1645_786928 [Glomus cerebriforme]